MKGKHHISVIVSIVISSIILSTSCTRKTWHTSSGVVWGTIYNIKYLSADNLDDSIINVLNLVDSSLSMFNPGSTVSRINCNAITHTDAMFDEMFNVSKRINDLSTGLFDPTVGPLVELWGFGHNKNIRETPSDSAIAVILKSVGLNECSVENSRITKKNSRTIFDFSAIAKGYACDLIGRMMKRCNVDDYMIEIGGEIAVCGNGPSADRWNIMIDAPIEQVGTQGVAYVHVTDCGIATSGNYRNYRDFDTIRVGHTISPMTGSPVTTDILSATVISSTCAQADALATACMAMNIDEATHLIERLEGTSALFVLAKGEGDLQVITVGDLPWDVN